MTQNATVLQITPLHHADTCTLYAILSGLIVGYSSDLHHLT